MMQAQQDVDRTNPVGGTHQLVFLVAREIAEMERAKPAEGDVAADGLTVFADVTTRTARPSTGIVSPGLTTVCVPLAYNAGYVVRRKVSVASAGCTFAPWSMNCRIGIREASSARPP